MDPLLQRIVSSLERDAPDQASLELLGIRDAGKTSEVLLRAASHPDLAATRGRWLPELLLSGRPGYAAQCLEEVATRYRQTRGRALDLASVPLLPVVLGSSDFLARLLLRHPNWIDELKGNPPLSPSPQAPPERSRSCSYPTVRPPSRWARP